MPLLSDSQIPQIGQGRPVWVIGRTASPDNSKNLTESAFTRNVMVVTQQMTYQEQAARNAAIKAETRPDVLDVMASSKAVSDRCAVAASPYITIETGLRLAKDRNYQVRMALLRRPNTSPTPQPILDVLVHDKHRSVRVAVPRCPSATLQHHLTLMQDPDVIVRARTASASMYPEVVQIAVNDSNTEVVQSIAWRTDVLSEEQCLQIARSTHEQAKSFLAVKTLYVSVQQVLVNDPSVKVRDSLAGNRELHSKVRTQLANDIQFSVALRLLRTYMDTDEGIAQAVFVRIPVKDHRNMEWAIALTSIPVMTRAQAAAASRSVRVRTALFETLTNEDVQMLATCDDKKIRAWTSKYLVRHAMR